MRPVLKRELKQIKRSVSSNTTDIHRYFSWYERTMAEIDEKPSGIALDFMAKTLFYVAENIEREQAIEAARNRTREEWIGLEERYQPEPIRISLEDVFDGAMQPIEDARAHYLMLCQREQVAGSDMSELKHAAVRKVWRSCEDFEQRRSGYKKCAYVFCHGYFKPHHGHQRYCCDKHKRDQGNAERNFRRTSQIYRAGTYLPETAYIPKRSATIEKAHHGVEVVDYGAFSNKFYAFAA